ncbi:MAG: hypothetical protein ACR2L3_02935 [Actinomycetota bacterium]
MKKILLVCALSAGLLACSRVEEALPPPRTEPSAPQSSSPNAADLCPNEEEATAIGTEEGSQSEHDVDGDGASEQIFVAKDPEGPPGCQAFLGLVGDSFGTLIAPVDDELAFELGLPAVSGVAEVDGLAPKEIIVDVASGASTAFAGLFSVQDGRLVRRTLEGDSPYARSFPYGGSVGHLEGSDCSGPGTLVITVAIPRGKGYLVHRRFFKSDGSAFILDLSLSEKQIVVSSALDDIPELSGALFGSCPR